MTIERISIVPPPQPKPADVPAQVSAATAEPAKDAPPPSPTPPPLPVPHPIPLWMWIAGGAVFLTVLIIASAVGVALYLKPAPVVAVVSQGAEGNEPKQPSDAKKPEGDGSAQTDSKQPKEEARKEGPGPGNSTADTGDKSQDSGEKPKPGNDVPPSTQPAPIFKYDGDTYTVKANPDTPDENGKALQEAIENADEGDIILLEGGASYVVEGLEIERAIRIAGQKNVPTPPVIMSSSEKKPPIRVTAKGATLENLMVIQNGSRMPAVHCTRDAEVALLSCILTSKSNMVLNVQLARTFTALNCGFASMASTREDSNIAALAGQPMEGAPGLSFNFAGCDFAGGQTGVRVVAASKGEFKACKFHDIGLSDGSGSVLNVSGTGVSLTADQCEFYKNHTGISVTSGSLEVKGGSFTDNGVPGDGSGKNAQPLGGVLGGGRLAFSGVTFKSNRQGLVAVGGGTLEVTDCQFEDMGVIAKHTTIQFICNVLAAQGKSKTEEAPATIKVVGSDFTRCNSRLASIHDAGELTMENCKGISGSSDILAIGGGAPCRASVKNCQFNKFTVGGISVSEGSSLTMEDGELQENTVGIEARDDGTQVQVSNVAFVGNDVLGIAAYGKAEVTAQGCTFQDNGYGGVQSGLPGKPDMATTVNLVDCKLYNSRSMDAQACAKSRLTLKNCTFAPGASPRVVCEPTGIVEADPPIQTLASNKGNGQPIPANKGTASNTTGGKPSAPRKNYQPPQQQRPAPSRQPNSLPNKVGEVIDAIDKVKRLIR